MNEAYSVGFKDVYPWVWSVMLGVSLTLADRRGAFQAAGTKTQGHFWVKNLAAVIFNVAIPSVVFGIIMTRLGPLYSANMGFWQILGVLYLAGVPLGAHHAWRAVATKYGWVLLNDQERRTVRITPLGHLVWATLAFVVPTLAAIFGCRIP